MPLDLTTPISYLITDGRTTRDTSSASTEFTRLFALVGACVLARITLIQLREKLLRPRVLYELTRRAAELTRGSETRLLINDRADIALAAGAAGVHVGAADLPVVAVRRFAPSGFIIGASLGSDDELANARDADYVGVGPVSSTLTKGDAGTAIGMEGFARLAGLVSLPAVGVGGIDPLAAGRLVAAGAAGVAVSSGIFSSLDPESATRQFASAIGT